MIVRPHYCNNKSCKIYQTAKQKEIEFSTSNGQKFLDNNLLNNPECQSCKQQNQNQQYFSIKHYIR